MSRGCQPAGLSGDGRVLRAVQGCVVQAGRTELRKRSPAPQSGMNMGKEEQDANEQTENLSVGNILMAPFFFFFLFKKW